MGFYFTKTLQMSSKLFFLFCVCFSSTGTVLSKSVYLWDVGICVEGGDRYISSQPRFPQKGYLVLAGLVPGVMVTNPRQIQSLLLFSSRYISKVHISVENILYLEILLKNAIFYLSV